ncbi:hypothetical protein M2449_003713 [Dysgonomonas sp. PF1-16]|nr:hypothetical protein [Dysgonomonas sp. PF1-16]
MVGRKSLLNPYRLASLSFASLRLCEKNILTKK